MFFFSSRRRHTRFDCDWSSDVCSSDLGRSIVCTVIAGNRISDKKGVSLPDTDLPVGALTEKDRADLDAVLSTGVDRSEERRVGKECRGGGAAYYSEMKIRNGVDDYRCA